MKDGGMVAIGYLLVAIFSAALGSAVTFIVIWMMIK